MFNANLKVNSTIKQSINNNNRINNNKIINNNMPSILIIDDEKASENVDRNS